ncbi:MAG: sulfur carrier protein ThiS [Planctomycetota bacterium]|nr:sulfur carrier protein ThiS [Planctomycetota bacterium]
MNITVNGQDRQVDDGTTIDRLLEELDLRGKYVAVEVNLELIPRANHEKHELAEGDRLEIVTLVGGG